MKIQWVFTTIFLMQKLVNFSFSASSLGNFSGELNRSNQLVFFKISVFIQRQLNYSLRSSGRQFIQFPELWLVYRTFWWVWESTTWSKTWSRNKIKFIILSHKRSSYLCRKVYKPLGCASCSPNISRGLLTGKPMESLVYCLIMLTERKVISMDFS